MTSTSFDVLGPLPSGTTLLEASAGTGKTFTIAALATRYIAEGAATIDQLLLITFGRSATRELRERVREALTAARDALRGASGHRDPVIDHLLNLPDDQRRAASSRLAQAVADFDSGTIATTHGFCEQALKAVGVHANTDPGETFVENITDLIDEVVDDFYIRKYANADPGQPRIPYAQAQSIARAAVDDPQAALDAGPVQQGSLEAARIAFAKAVRAEVLRRRRNRRLVTFDDLVLRLQQTVTDPQRAELACNRLRETYQVVLVDEFQDTDPAQWDILRTVFHGWRTLILIGDPKQAIYAFRGADVFSYLDAAEQAGTHATLPTNYRSDAAVVSGVEAIMGGLQLGDPRITVHPVRAQHQASRLVGLPDQARTRMRVIHPEEPPGVSPARTAVARDVAADIVSLLTGPARLDDDRPVAPGDVAVLVGTHVQAREIQTALARAKVPAVLNSSTSVFATAAAREWATVLAAMQRPRGSALRDAALTDFFGYSAEQVALHPEAVDAQVSQQLRQWAHALDEGSVAELVSLVESDQHLAARVLSHPDGERQLTDLRHIAGLLHAHERRAHTRSVALTDWLTDQIRRAEQGVAASELTRRLETDAQAVQVLTVHSSKGLEFPVVYVPFAWDRGKPPKDALLSCHDANGRRVLDVRGEDAINRADLQAARDAEDAGESLRLLYVALTRASSLLVVHWSSSKQNTRRGPLHRALCAQQRRTTVPASEYPADEPPSIESPWVSVEHVPSATPEVSWNPLRTASAGLSAAPFTRELDTQWRRTSYSGLTRAVHESERAPLGFHDDEPEEVPEQTADSAATGIVSPFAELPAGAAFGTLVHAVLEVVDTEAPDLGVELRERCEQQLVTHPVAGATVGLLAPAVLAAMSTPMGELAAGLTLAQFPGRDRLSELDFEFPMGNASVRTLADLAKLLREHLPDGDPLAGYADRIDSSGLAPATLVGYLSGSIDAVLRTPDQRFLVVDYKTNLLRDTARPGAENLAQGYRPSTLATAMMDAHYPLQALLYAAALHRYLRWRLPGYDPERHLGGVLYLFVRGMVGPDTPDGCGVFSWRPPAGAIVALSDLLDGRKP